MSIAPHHDVSPPLTERDAAPYTGYTPAAFRAWRREGRGPAYVRIGRSVRYLRDDLDTWIAAHRVTTRDSGPTPGRIA